MTHRARDVSLHLCTGSSYVRVSEALRRLWGSAPSAETLRREVLRTGQELSGQQRREAERVVTGQVEEPSKAPERMYVVLDGGWARGTKKRQWHEGKLGTVYTDRRARVSKGRYRLTDRVKVGTFGCSEQLGELVYAEAFGKGVERAGQVVVLGDGAGWIRTIKEHQFPQAELRLDAFHVLQALERGLRAAYPEDAGKRRQKKTQLKDLIWRGKLDEALRRLRLIARYAPQEASALHETIAYLSRQAPYIPAYGELQRRGEMISSALAEETVDRALNQRFKHGHRHWTRDGAEALLSLRLLVDNHRWDQYWSSTQSPA